MTTGPKVDYKMLGNFSVADFDLQTYYSAGRAAGLVVKSGKEFIDFSRRVTDSVINTLSLGSLKGINIKKRGKGKVHEKYFVGRKADLTELEYRKDYYTNIGKEIVDLTLSDHTVDDLTIIDTSRFNYSFDKIEVKSSTPKPVESAPKKPSKNEETKESKSSESKEK
ncbi:MAG: hypothetical protein HN353_09815 [Bdellovibrionales bacterium]|jgi:hypothetical protein|nr:hypothetical protein [Bdellovibrionales bacterium]MBT3527195.1 hypothetical protein [Bdellovibrionales bacterium]MBT7668487.1 hypothetical protein [Bdellovibrionales bacterium]MBT7765845.1 hypothetical protein [Bdellovibrionales bacterium]